MSESKQYFGASEALLDHIKAAFQASSPGILLADGGQLKVEALFSSPRIDADLYGLAHAAGAPVGPSSDPVRVWSEELVVTGIWINGTGEGILMYALSLTIYTLPAHRSGLVYVSKLDTTGYAPPTLSTWNDASSLPRDARSTVVDQWAEQRGLGSKEPTTIAKLLTESVLSYFVQLGHWKVPSPVENEPSKSAVDHVSLHVLARAQHAYLFPWSNKAQGKHILTDKQLIRWWRDVLSRVTLFARVPDTPNEQANSTKAFYVIPGYNSLESTDVVALPPTNDDKSPLAQARWTYGHPYASVWPNPQGNNLPLHHPSVPTTLRPPDRKGRRPTGSEDSDSLEPSIASLVPSFDDDPKGRFLSELVEIAYDQTHGVKVGGKRRANAEPEEANKKARFDAQNSDAAQAAPHTESSEQKLGGEASSSAPVALTSAQKDAWRERAELDKVSAAEFWERMGFRQECNSGNAVGVFVLLVQRPTPAHSVSTEEHELPTNWRTSLGALPGKTLHDLVIQLLLLDKNDWSTASSAAKLTTKWVQTVGNMICRKGEAPRSVQLAQTQALKATDGEAPDTLNKAIYTLIPISPPPADVLTKAEERYEQKKRLNPISDTSVSAPRTLTVKRKRKPAA